MPLYGTAVLFVSIFCILSVGALANALLAANQLNGALYAIGSIAAVESQNLYGQSYVSGIPTYTFGNMSYLVT